MTTSLVEWQENEFNEALKQENLCVVEFSAPWCNACKITEPAVVEVAGNLPEAKFAKVDVSKNPGLASRMGVMSLPNILIIVKGQVKEQIIGAANKSKIDEKVRKYI